jgi:hypothetical protein
MKDDLDTLIRRAEMAVVETDRRLLQEAQRLVPAGRQAGQRAAWIGGACVAVAVSTWLVMRALTGPPPRQHHRHPVSAPPPRRAKAADRPSRGWGRVMQLGGVLLGTTLRSGLSPAPKAAAAPLVSAGLRWFTRQRGDAAERASRPPRPAERNQPAGRSAFS